jgi:hypothetical protein
VRDGGGELQIYYIRSRIRFLCAFLAVSCCFPSLQAQNFPRDFIAPSTREAQLSP